MKLFLPILIFSIVTFSSAQKVEIVSDLSITRGIAIFENDIYLTETGKISKINIDDDNTDVVDVTIDTGDLLYSLAINGNDLYIAQRREGKILKIDLRDPDLTITTLVTGLDNPRGIAINNNYLYIAERRNISKVDILSDTFEKIDIISGLSSPYGMDFNGNFLYIAEFTGSKVSRLNFNENNPVLTDVITGLANPYNLAFNNDYLYITEFSAGKILKVDTSTDSFNSEDFLTNLKSPTGILFNEGFLYFIENESNTSSLWKFDMSTLSVSDNPNQISTIKLYPNPSSESVQIIGLNEPADFKVYNINGHEMHSGTIKINSKIDVSYLSTGIYFLNVGDRTTIKFIKK